jgi:hypothetical protein
MRLIFGQISVKFLHSGFFQQSQVIFFLFITKNCIYKRKKNNLYFFIFLNSFSDKQIVLFVHPPRTERQTSSRPPKSSRQTGFLSARLFARMIKF